MTTVAAIVCAHTIDRWDDIGKALASLSAQERRADHIILAIDNNVELYSAARATFCSGVDVVHNTGVSGVSATRNVAARATDADVLAYLDDDAEADPGWLKALMKWYDDSTVVGVGGLAHPSWVGGSRPTWFPPSFDWVVGCSHSGVPTIPGPVRNFIGCNMSLRRSAWVAVDGFAEDVGRVGSNGGGGDETDFCLRVADQVGGVIMHEPGAIVSHRVPFSRQNLRYFIARCRAEGVSKRRIASRSGSGTTLRDEQAHLRSTLPREFFAGLPGVARGESAGLKQSSVIVVGVVATIGGYVSRPRRDNSEAEIVGFRPAEVTTIDVDVTRTAPAVNPEKRVFALVRSGPSVLGILQDGEERTGVELLDSSVVPRRRVDAGELKSVAVVIATRDRTDSLRRTLDSLRGSTVQPDQLIVVDSAGADDESERLIEEWNRSGERPITYVRSSRPGLAIAHNVGLELVDAKVVALTDDDVLIDRYWLEEILVCFADHPDAACVTGGIMPAELDTWPQQWAEESSRFNKGFSTHVFDTGRHRPLDDPLFPFAAGTMGSGANMAFTVDWLRSIGGFREELGAGSVALGGDDLRAFYDVVASGKQLVFNPHAIVHHHHHRTAEAIERQSYGYGAGLTAFLASVVHHDPASAIKMARRAPKALRHAMHVSSPVLSHSFPGQTRRTRMHRRGMLSGPVRYVRSTWAQR